MALVSLPLHGKGNLVGARRKLQHCAAPGVTNVTGRPCREASQLQEESLCSRAPLHGFLVRARRSAAAFFSYTGSLTCFTHRKFNIVHLPVKRWVLMRIQPVRLPCREAPARHGAVCLGHLARKRRRETWNLGGSGFHELCTALSDPLGKSFGCTSVGSAAEPSESIETEAAIAPKFPRREAKAEKRVVLACRELPDLCRAFSWVLGASFRPRRRGRSQMHRRPTSVAPIRTPIQDVPRLHNLCPGQVP